MSSHTEPAVRAYLARVRTALSDLPSAEVDEIVEDVRPHLAEIAEGLEETRPDVPAMIAELGTPEDYAAEVRAAGDYPLPPEQPEQPEPQSDPARRGPSAPRRALRAAMRRDLLVPRLAFWGLLAGALSFLGAGFIAGGVLNAEGLFSIVLPLPIVVLTWCYVWWRGTDAVRDLPEVRRLRGGPEGAGAHRMMTALRMLNPVWWVLCAVILVMLGALLVVGSENVLAVPVMLALAAVAVWAGPKSHSDRRMVWAALPVSAFVIGASLGMTLYMAESVERQPHFASYHQPHAYGTDAAGDPVLTYGSERLENIYVFDAEGNPVKDVYLYDEDGQPIIVPRYACDDETKTRLRVGEDNLFPRPSLKLGAEDDRGVANGYNAYRPYCEESDTVPFRVGVPKDKPGN